MAMLARLRLRIDFVDLVDLANFDNSNRDVHCCSHSYSSNTNCFNKHLNEMKSRMKMLTKIDFAKTTLENCIDHVLQYVELIY